MRLRRESERARGFVAAWHAFLLGRDSIARATADFVLITLARSRPQQVPIAIAASIAVAIIGVALATREGGLEELQTPRTVVLWIPIVLGYWIIVGLRASFIMPTELAGGMGLPGAFTHAVCVVLGRRARGDVAFAIGPALAANVSSCSARSAGESRRFTRCRCLASCITAQFASLLIDSVPFTRAYPPGHAKLKTRWPLYLLGMYAVAYIPVQLELRRLDDPLRLIVLAGAGAVLVVVLELIGRRKALKWEAPPESELSDDPEALTLLNIGPWSKPALPNS